MKVFVNLIILKVSKNIAGIPNGWADQEFSNWPWKMNEIDRPRPHPGQYSKPRLCKGQIVPVATEGSIIARIKSPANQITASIGKLKTFFTSLKVVSENFQKNKASV
jgi:hypothetical protein